MMTTTHDSHCCFSCVDILRRSSCILLELFLLYLLLSLFLLLTYGCFHRMEQANGIPVRGTWYIAVLEHMGFNDFGRGQHICCMILMTYELHQ
jgi:hypothetical protein